MIEEHLTRSRKGAKKFLKRRHEDTKGDFIARSANPDDDCAPTAHGFTPQGELPRFVSSCEKFSFLRGVA